MHNTSLKRIRSVILVFLLVFECRMSALPEVLELLTKFLPVFGVAALYTLTNLLNSLPRWVFLDWEHDEPVGNHGRFVEVEDFERKLNFNDGLACEPKVRTGLRLHFV